MTYQPYKYPPDLELAKIHSDCSLPGDFNPDGRICPCCGVQQKTPILNWWSRNIGKDFSRYGGAVITYFSLVKFYAIAVLVIILTYSIFEMISIINACHKQQSEGSRCIFTFGVWIISTVDLLDIIDEGVKISLLLTLRGLVFVFLILVNMFSLYIIERDRRKLQRKKRGIQDYSLFFKNVNPNLTQQQFRQQLLKLNQKMQIRQVFFLNRLHHIKKWYDIKIQNYFSLKILKKQKQIIKAKKLLMESIEKLRKYMPRIQQKSNRVIVMFNRLEHRELVKEHYKPSIIEKIKILFTNYEEKMYADHMHRPNQVFWHYLGQASKQKLQMKIITAIVIVVTLALTYILLKEGLALADKNDRSNIPIILKFWSSFIAIILVVIALMFRALMNYLAQLRKPNTQTSKTMFIVCTTVIYHFIYYIIVPTFYLQYAENEERSLKLFSVSYQALNFLIVQIIMVVTDVFYYLWNANRKKIFTNNNNDLGLCQKQLHVKVSAPRFPIEFKLIILFKTWSFVIFYAFEVPYIMILIFLILLSFIILDKKNVYLHYKMEIIDSKVELTFLKIYTNFFVLYLCLIFSLTQNVTYQIYIAVIISFMAILFQLLYAVRDRTMNYDVNLQNITLEQLAPEKTFKQLYEEFTKSFNNPTIDEEIQKYYDNISKSKPNLDSNNFHEEQKMIQYNQQSQDPSRFTTVQINSSIKQNPNEYDAFKSKNELKTQLLDKDSKQHEQQ